MNSNTAKLPKTTEEFNVIVLNLKNQIKLLEEQIDFLKRKLFNPKSEKLPLNNTAQISLFDEAEITGDASPVSEPKKENKAVVPTDPLKKTGRKPLPKDLPRIEVVHDLYPDAL